jgi:hypothetical protein
MSSQLGFNSDSPQLNVRYDFNKTNEGIGFSIQGSLKLGNKSIPVEVMSANQKAFADVLQRLITDVANVMPQEKMKGMKSVEMGLKNGKIEHLSITTDKETYVVQGKELEAVNKKLESEILKTMQAMQRLGVLNPPQVHVSPQEEARKKVIEDSLKQLPSLPDIPPKEEKAHALFGLIHSVLHPLKNKVAHQIQENTIDRGKERRAEKKELEEKKAAVKEDIDKQYQQIINLSSELGWDFEEHQKDPIEAQTASYKEFLTDRFNLS